jgi:hypothetical protein
VTLRIHFVTLFSAVRVIKQSMCQLETAVVHHTLNMPPAPVISGKE